MLWYFKSYITNVRVVVSCTIFALFDYRQVDAALSTTYCGSIARITTICSGQTKSAKIELAAAQDRITRTDALRVIAAVPVRATTVRSPSDVVTGIYA